MVSFGGGRRVSAIRSLFESPRTPFEAVPAALWEADAWLALGEFDRSRAALEAPETDGVPDVWLARARLELAEGDPEAALRCLGSFQDSEREPFMPYAGSQALALEALARDALRDEAAALDALERCLDLVEPRGNGGVLLASRRLPLRSLLRRAIARGTSHRSLAEDLLAMLDDESVSDARAHPAAVGSAQRAGARRPTIPPDDAVERRDRQRDVRVGEHRQDPPQARVPQARRGGPPAGGAPRARAAPAESRSTGELAHPVSLVSRRTTRKITAIRTVVIRPEMYTDASG